MSGAAYKERGIARAAIISKILTRCGGVLLLITSLLLVLMPWTEYFWHFDQFLRGGQDFELNIIAVMSVFCLVLILLQQAKRCVALFFWLCRLLGFLYEADDPAVLQAIYDRIELLRRPNTSASIFDFYNLPIQV